MNPPALRKRLRILITAGPTREYIDSVRYISNDSTGKMGFALAAAAARAGHRVTIVHGPVTLAAPTGVRTLAVISAREMLAACRREWRKHDVLIAAAAVADFRPAVVATNKLKKERFRGSLKLVENPDILAVLSADRRADQLAIGFALEDRDARRHAKSKLVRKKLDAIILNHPSAIAAESSFAEILTPGGDWLVCPRQTKARLARRLVRFVESLARKRRE